MAEKKKWIQGAIKHPGSFKAAAKKHGMSTSAFTAYVLSHKNKFSKAMIRKAVLARTLSGMPKKR